MNATGGRVARFERDFFDAGTPFTAIGGGELGGKAQGLAFIERTLRERFPAGEIAVAIPQLAVITTEHFDAFVDSNGLREVVASDPSDERIAHRFLQGDLPSQLAGDLRALVAAVHSPLAVRSSSLLEDALGRPFAGVYATKMTPNNQLDADSRFRRLVEAVKLVWASTFFREARAYLKTVRRESTEEKMAVIVQQVVGARHGDRFYPDVSGVARSYNFYPSGHARPGDGVASLALGLGRTIVDGEPCWTFSPAYPKAPPPYNSIGELLDATQREFWAVNMGRAPYDPGAETEYLVHCPLADAETDGTLRYVASTYDPQAQRITAGAGVKGPRLVNFAPILSYGRIPLNDTVRVLLRACEDALGQPAEIEFAVTMGQEGAAHLGFLQLRPLVVGHEAVTVEDAELEAAGVLAAGRRVLGNGTDNAVSDIVYVKPGAFEVAETPAIAAELEALNDTLVREGRPYVLIGFGRWGTSDRWGGVPVVWGQICGVRAIVEASTAGFGADLSQGSHFFHNLTSFSVLYFSLDAAESGRIDWAWLDARPAAAETAHLRHVRTAAPLSIKVDGRTGRGVIAHHD
jgi:Pyruvate phosphate dikinase, AMP/ATP-binding domain